MGSDGALDSRDIFMSRFDTEDCYFFERPREEIRDGLLALTLSEIKEMADQDITRDDKFVIPYTFVEYEAYPTDPEIKAYLLECLDSHDDLTGQWNYCNGEEMEHVELFKKNFDDIISGKKTLDGDQGLFAAIEDHLASGKTGLVNLTSDDDD
jgi:hypothetical protein